MKYRKQLTLLMIATLCLTGCSKESEEEVPVETKPAIVTKNEDLGGTKTGNEEEIEEAENALKRGIVSFYANDVESFVASTDVDVLYAMMYGKALNQAEKTEFVASLKERLPVPVYDEHNKQKIVDYTLKEAPNERIYDEGTKKLRSLDWLSDLTFQIPTNVAVEVDFDKIEYISKGQENAIWSFFQGDRELDYIQKSAVMISEPKDNYEIDKIYEIPYTLVTDEELEEYETTAKIEKEYVGYAVHIRNKNDDEDEGEWKYEIVLENVDAVFGQYLSESGIDETVPENPEPAPEENAESAEGEVPAEADGEANES